MLNYRQVELDEMSGRDLMPMGLLDATPESISHRTGIHFSREFDGFDDCDIAALKIDGSGIFLVPRGQLPLTIRLTVGLRTYIREKERGETSILLPADTREGHQDILVSVTAVMLKMPYKRILWPQDIGSFIYAGAIAYVNGNSLFQTDNSDREALERFSYT